jgi:hypothetical protein
MPDVVFPSDWSGMTQRKKTLLYMIRFGEITPLDALRDFGCMRLAARIAELRREGHRIRQTMISDKNRWGDRVTYARYSLEKDDV